MSLHSFAAMRCLLRCNAYTEPLVFIVRHHRANRMPYKALLDAEGNRLDTRNKLNPLREEIAKSEISMKPGAEILPEIKQPGKKLVIKPKKFPAGRPEEHSGSTRTTTNQNKSDAADRISGHQLTRHKRESAQLPRLAHIALQTEDLSEEKEDHEDTKAETSAKFFIPRYTKIHAWDKSNSNVKKLGQLLTSKKERQESDLVVVEGTRIINDALQSGVKPELLVFSRVKLLAGLNLDPEGTDYACYHVPYTNIKLWSDLSTPTGLMAAFSKEKLRQALRPANALRLSLVCDNIRTPDNLGAVMRVAAAAGARQVVLTRGCVEAWSPKVVRAAAGAHFQVPVVEGVSWDVLENQLESFPQVILADLVHQQESSLSLKEKEAVLEELELKCQEEGYHLHLDESAVPGEPVVSRDLSYLDPELTSAYRQLPVQTLAYSAFAPAPGCGEAVVVVGGETEGVSDAAYRFCHKYNGARLYIPLLNGVSCLNVVSAASIVLFRVQEALLQGSASEAASQPADLHQKIT